MAVSVTSFLTAILLSSVCVLLVDSLFRHTKLIGSIGINFFFLMMTFIYIRMLLPLEFPFIKHLFIAKAFPPLSNFLRTPLGNFSEYKFEIYHVFLFLWALGTVLVGARTISQYFKLQRLLRRSPKTDDPTVLSILEEVNKKHRRTAYFQIICIDRLPAPAITGILHPKILLPKRSLEPKELYYTLLHEATHYYQFDLWKKLGVTLISIFYWWNPFVWRLKKNFTKALELKTDWVLTHSMSEAEVTDYLECLLLASKSSLPKSDYLISFGSSDASFLKQRFHLISDKMSGSGRMQKQRILTLCSIVLLILSFCFISEPSLNENQTDTLNSFSFHY